MPRYSARYIHVAVAVAGMKRGHDVMDLEPGTHDAGPAASSDTGMELDQRMPLDTDTPSPRRRPAIPERPTVIALGHGQNPPTSA